MVPALTEYWRGTGANLGGATIDGVSFLGALWTDGWTICQPPSIGTCTP